MTEIPYHLDRLALVLSSLFALAVACLGSGIRRFLQERARADRVAAEKEGRERRLRTTWEQHARALGLHPRDDETVDELMERVLETRATGAFTTEVRAAEEAAREGR